jgi:hypothetical protein
MSGPWSTPEKGAVERGGTSAISGIRGCGFDKSRVSVFLCGRQRLDVDPVRAVWVVRVNALNQMIYDAMRFSLGESGVGEDAERKISHGVRSIVGPRRMATVQPLTFTARRTTGVCSHQDLRAENWARQPQKPARAVDSQTNKNATRWLSA